ncbi:MAG: hypothetical protein ABII79_00905 [bacterium]
MPQNLYDAHRQWATRPPDQRFANLDELYSFTLDRKQNSKELLQSLQDLPLTVTPEGAVALNGNAQHALLSNWAFGQLCRNIEAPASYLRTLPPDMAKDCLQHGLKRSDANSKILVREEFPETNDPSYLWASAFTSASYGRIWDADVVRSLKGAVQGTSWRVPPARSSNKSENSGLYASDHDMFAFMVNDENPVEIGNARLGRGFFIWNSETGASTFGLTTFLYNYVCGNHIVWGAENVKEMKIYHRSHAPQHFYHAALPLLNRFAENTGLDDSIRVTADRAMEMRIGNSLEDTLAWFKAKPFTKKEVSGAWVTGTAEGEDVTNLWGMVQGLTAYARDMAHVDKRVNLERRAGALLAG